MKAKSFVDSWPRRISRHSSTTAMMAGPYAMWHCIEIGSWQYANVPTQVLLCPSSIHVTFLDKHLVEHRILDCISMKSSGVDDRLSQLHCTGSIHLNFNFLVWHLTFVKWSICCAIALLCMKALACAEYYWWTLTGRTLTCRPPHILGVVQVSARVMLDGGELLCAL